jgi:hypothetical protein
MARYEQKIGKHGEQLTASTLRAIGIEMVEKIGTPVTLLPAKTPGTYRVIWGEKVSGDRRGIIPGSGRSVLVEAKTIMDRKLRWSDLREHQPGRLTQHADLGGLSLLAWVHSTGVYILRWPVAGFGPGKSIDVSQASRSDICHLAKPLEGL